MARIPRFCILCISSNTTINIIHNIRPLRNAKEVAKAFNTLLFHSHYRPNHTLAHPF